MALDFALYEAFRSKPDTDKRLALEAQELSFLQGLSQHRQKTTNQKSTSRKNRNLRKVQNRETQQFFLIFAI